MKTHIDRIDGKTLTKRFGSPLYVYDAEVIQARCRELKQAFPTFTLYYACKANTNPEIVRLVFNEGFSIEAVSPGEIKVARKVGVPVSQIAFTCGNIHPSEIISVGRQKVRMHLDSLTQVEEFGRHFPGRDISVRLNLGVGAGHHSHVITGGPDSKFGIDIAHIDKLKKIAAKYRLRITGLHQHIGSNILEVPIFLKAMDVLFSAASHFDTLEHLDFGGGFGVPYNPGESRLDITKLGRAVGERVKKFSRSYGNMLKMSFEPGRYLVAESGNLLVTVVDIKKNPKKTFVGVDSGMGHLIRPAMYGSHHMLENASRPKGVPTKVTVAGNYCESGDVLATDRVIALPQLGDVLVIKSAGAYGYAMSSDYNLRPRPVEVLVSKKQVRLIRKQS